MGAARSGWPPTNPARGNPTISRANGKTDRSRPGEIAAIGPRDAGAVRGYGISFMRQRQVGRGMHPGRPAAARGSKTNHWHSAGICAVDFAACPGIVPRPMVRARISPFVMPFAIP